MKNRTKQILAKALTMSTDIMKSVKIPDLIHLVKDKKDLRAIAAIVITLIALIVIAASVIVPDYFTP